MPIASEEAYASVLADIPTIEVIQETAQEITSNMVNIPEYHYQLKDHLMNGRDYATALEMTVNSLISNKTRDLNRNKIRNQTPTKPQLQYAERSTSVFKPTFSKLSAKSY